MRRLRNPEDVSSVVRPQLDSILDRARASGASDDLEYLGAGMTSVVLQDHGNGVCFKIARRDRDHDKDNLEDEYDWLVAANKVPAIARFVVKPIRYHRDQATIERKCVHGRPGRWSDESDLHKLHRDIEKHMIPRGWTAPEFKGDSYICTDAKTWKCDHPVLVDAGIAQRVGKELIKMVVKTMKTKKFRSGESATDLKFYVRREKGVTIEPEMADRLLRLLEKI